jgi:ankyrin repeat protein
MQPTKRLLTAVSEDDLVTVQRLVAEGASVDWRDEHGHCGLSIAVREGYTGMLAWLLQAGADADAIGCNNHPVIVLATLSGHQQAVELLLAAGADPNRARVHGGETAMHAAAIGRQPALVRQLAAAGALINVFTAKQVESDLLWNITLTADTPLHLAACYAEAPMVECLLELGANPRLENYRQETPLACALRMHRPMSVLRPLRGGRYAAWSENLPVRTAWAG